MKNTEKDFIKTIEILKKMQNKLEDGKKVFLPIVKYIEDKLEFIIPILEENDNIQLTEYYVIDLVTGEIIEEKIVYESEKFELSELSNYNFQSEKLENIYNILDELRQVFSNKEKLRTISFLNQYYKQLETLSSLNNIYEKILKKIKILKFYKKYNFEWNLDKGLRYIDDKMLKIAMYLVENAEIDFSLNSENKIDIYSNYFCACDNKYTLDDILYACDNNGKFKDGNNILRKKYGQYTGNNGMSQNMQLDICDYPDCKYTRCLDRVVFYVKYLVDNGLLEEKLKDRYEFRKNNKINGSFSFDWEIKNGLKNVSKNIFDIANELVKQGLVTVNRDLDKSGYVKIKSAISCSQYKKIKNVEDIKNVTYGKIGKTFLQRSPNTTDFNLCDAYTCRLLNCPYAVAGYIYYLINSNKEEEILSDREYYIKNELNIIEELKKEKKNKIAKVEKESEKKTRELEKYFGKINNLQQLIDNLRDKNRDSLYCIIEGERGLEQEEIVNKIAEVLKNSGRISSKEQMTLLNLAISSTVYSSPVPTIKYSLLQKNKLYIITGLEEFNKDYKIYKNSSSNETRLKQFAHILKILGRIEENNYVIILGESKHINEFLEIDLKIKNVYRECRLVIENLTIDEIYKEYKNSININLYEELRENEKKFKNKFIEFVTFNRNAMPFNNKELAEYLALYSNSRNKLILPENLYKKETIDQALKNIIGLENVKNKVKDFEKYMIFYNKAIAMGINLPSPNMHMMFTGNPGCGKTTIARIMAKMLFDLGILKENKLIEVERKDLVGQYIGHTAPKTSDIISKAIGGVLFIDEAYSLTQKSEKDFGQEALATLIKAMEDHKGEFVVIFAGYKNEMQDFVDSNPGIASRIGYIFDFPDYSPEELIEIFKLKMKNMGFNLHKDIDIDFNLKEIFEYFSKRKAFGNGRFVDKVIQETLINHANDDNIQKLSQINKTNLPSITTLTNSIKSNNIDSEEMLKKVVGLENLKKKIREFESYIKFLNKAKKQGIQPPIQNMHMLFTGNPGCGKTTIARIMTKMLFDLGILKENKLIEVERKDLVASYIGQTAPKTNEVIEKSLGGVLFIDEAYSLTPKDFEKDFGQEALVTLIKAMEDHKGEFVVIFAGYKNEMQNFVDSNPGIASRIGYTFDFPDYSAEELTEIFNIKMLEYGFEVDKDVSIDVLKFMQYFCNVKNIGNGRFVDKVIQEVLIKHSTNSNFELKKILKNDIPKINEMIKNVTNSSRMIDPEKLTDEVKRAVAIHEIGHAIVAISLFSKSSIKKITINPEGTGTLGYVLHENFSDYISSKSKLENIIKLNLGGMAAEEVCLGEYTNGNSSDLHSSICIAHQIIESGMSKLGLGYVLSNKNNLPAEVREEVNRILEECYNETKALIVKKRNELDKAVEILLEKGEISEEELIKIINIKTLEE